MPVKPVVFVPGLPGSSLIDRKEGETIFFRPRRLDDSRWKKQFLDRLSGPDDPEADDGVEAGEPIGSLFDSDEPFLDVGAGKQAAAMYDLLRRIGHRADQWRGVAWDWRRPVDAAVVTERIGTAVRELAERTGAPVAVLAHGAGGLAVRAALATDPDLARRIADLVFLGVPWAGCLEPLRYLAGQHGFGALHKKEVAEVFGKVWSMWDLLPPHPEAASGATPRFEVDGAPATPLTGAGWIPRAKAAAPLRKRAERALAHRPSSPDLDLGPTRIWNLAGWGLPTVEEGRVEEKQIVLGDPSPDGDGMVPLASASWLAGPEVRNLIVPLGGFTPARHHVIWTARAARPLLREILGSEVPWVEHVDAAVDTGDATSDPAAVEVRVIAQDERGASLPGAHARLPEHDGEEAVAAGPDGRMVLRIDRQRWRWTRADVRQVRILVTWDDAGRERQKDLRVLAGRDA